LLPRSFLFFRRTQKQNTRVYAAITRLQTGVLTQQQLMERSRRTGEAGETRQSLAGDPQKLELQKKSQDLDRKLQSARPKTPRLCKIN